MEQKIHELELPGGETVLARAEVLKRDDVALASRGYGNYEDVTALDVLADRVDSLTEVVGTVGRAIRRAAESATPDEVSATFGIELAAKAGRAVAVLADGEAKASISVTLTWRPGSTVDNRTPDASADA